MAWDRLVHLVVSRSLRRIYRALPLFGRLRGSLAVIREGNRYVVIERSDGLGLSFPGGMQWPWESDEETVRRETREETGLVLGELTRLFSYDDNSIVPARTSVFGAQAAGAVRGSWEGRVLRVSLEELRRGVISSEAPVVRYLEEHGPEAGPPSARGKSR